jgi:tetratricopeptide (TPR) repeat protein
VNETGEHALLNISRLYLRQAKYEEAKASLERLATTSSNARFKAEAYQNLAEVHRTQMNYAEARTAIEKSLELDPAVPQAWVTRGRVRMAAFLDGEDSEETIESDVKTYADRALSINPNQASAYAMLYDLASAKGDTELREMYKQKALEALQRDISLGQKERQTLKNYLEAEIVVVQGSDGAAAAAE